MLESTSRAGRGPVGSGSRLRSADRARQPVREPDAEHVAFIARLVYDRTGIVLRPEKTEMVKGRLARRLRAHGLTSLAEYRQLIEAEPAGVELGHMLNALTTNLTAFFREPHHFEHLAKVALPEIVAKNAAGGSNRLRIWSAGCSSGQEPYSIAMTVAASVPNLARWDARILATDLDTEMIARASAGRYDEGQCESIPPAHRGRYAVQRGCAVMDQGLRDLIVFNQLNLMDPWPMRGPFDAVFCRNVVIYFDKPTQAKLFDRIADMLAPGGWLYIGHSEALFNVTSRFEPAGKTTYRRAR
ncbi:MAG: protein-glutamate O-methyltransferase CheR [Alphaproteobacteria bacterium]|nr:protein-glutamate O-methyltransferase CheR [Alphaproteobacteria bacterium]